MTDSIPPEHPYRLVILGGGPAGCSILVRAIRLGLLSELCQPDEDGSVGIGIIDRDSMDNFGRGKLGQYVIRGNTYAQRFVHNASSDLPDQDPPERASGTALESLWENTYGKCLRDCFGRAYPPLSVIGSFLREIGQSVLQEIRNCNGRIETCFHSEVITIYKMASGFYEIHYLQYIGSHNPVKYFEGFNISQLSQQEMENSFQLKKVVAKHIVFGLGGTQKYPLEVIPQKYQPKVFLSDYFLTAEGFQSFQEKLLTKIKLNRRNKKLKICIVGGSHSAFSSAWLLLNGPATEHTNCSHCDESDRSSISSKEKLDSTSSELDSDGAPDCQLQLVEKRIKIVNRNLQIIPNPKVAQNIKKYCDTWTSNDLDSDKQDEQSKPSTSEPKSITTKPKSISVEIIKTSGKQTPHNFLKRTRSSNLTVPPNNVKMLHSKSDSNSTVSSSSTSPHSIGLLQQSKNAPTKQEPKLKTKVQLLTKKNDVVHKTYNKTTCKSNCKSCPVLDFEKNSIQIYHKSDIQVYYESLRDAIKDGYKKPEDQMHPNGKVLPFGGLRGDSKLLYRNISKGRENRVQLIRLVGDQKLQAKTLERAFDSSTAIIWAGGYCSNIVPFFDENHTPMKIKYDNNLVDVDSTARIRIVSKLDSDQSSVNSDNNIEQSSTPKNFNDPTFIPNVYGIGLGFGLRAKLSNNQKDGPTGRADAVHVFVKRTASLILSHVLGPQKVFRTDVASFQEKIQKFQELQNLSKNLHSSEMFQIHSQAIFSSLSPQGTRTINNTSVLTSSKNITVLSSDIKPPNLEKTQIMIEENDNINPECANNENEKSHINDPTELLNDNEVAPKRRVRFASELNEVNVFIPLQSISTVDFTSQAFSSNENSSFSSLSSRDFVSGSSAHSNIEDLKQSPEVRRQMIIENCSAYSARHDMITNRINQFVDTLEEDIDNETEKSEVGTEIDELSSHNIENGSFARELSDSNLDCNSKTKPEILLETKNSLPQPDISVSNLDLVSPRLVDAIHKSKFSSEIQNILEILSRSLGLVPFSILDGIRSIIELEKNTDLIIYDIIQYTKRICDCMLPYISLPYTKNCSIHIPKILLDDFRSSSSEYLWTLREMIDQISHVLDLVEGVVEIWKAKAAAKPTVYGSISITDLNDSNISAGENLKWTFRKGAHDLSTLMKHLVTVRDSYYEKCDVDEGLLDDLMENLNHLIKIQQRIKIQRLKKFEYLSNPSKLIHIQSKQYIDPELYNSESDLQQLKENMQSVMDQLRKIGNKLYTMN